MSELERGSELVDFCLQVVVLVEHVGELGTLSLDLQLGVIMLLFRNVAGLCLT